MPNWSVKATAAAPDTVNNNGNIIVTFQATNAVTNEVVTEQAYQNSWTVEKAIAYAQGMVDRLNKRDELKATAASVLPGIQAYIAQNNILATG